MSQIGTMGHIEPRAVGAMELANTAGRIGSRLTPTVPGCFGVTARVVQAVRTSDIVPRGYRR